MSVRMTRYEAFVEGKKYLHKKGILYTIRDRESDDDYDLDEKWTFDAWCGPECQDAEAIKKFQTASKPSPMLLGPYAPVVWRKYKTVYVSEKYDGWRCYFRNNTFYTRNGNVIHLAKEFKDALAAHAGMEFDGELWLGYGTTSSDVAAMDAVNVTFKVFDVPNVEGTFEERLQLLKSLTFSDSRIQLVDHIACHNEKEMEAVYDAVMARGGEGVVLRMPDQKYTHNVREPLFMKKKPLESLEAKVVDYYQTPAAKKVEGYVSSLIVTSLDGKNTIFKVSIKTTTPPPIGSIVTVRYCQESAHGLPKFPVLVGIRAAEDMPADVTAHIKAPKPKLGKTKVVCRWDLAELDRLLKHPSCTGVITQNFLDKNGPQPLEPGHHVYLDNGRCAYKVSRTRGGDSYYCSCEAWMFQGLHAAFRTCKHCIAVGDWQPIVPFALRKAAADRKETKKVAKKDKVAALLAPI
jgi:DNA ligase-1